MVTSKGGRLARMRQMLRGAVDYVGLPAAWCFVTAALWAWPALAAGIRDGFSPDTRVWLYQRGAGEMYVSIVHPLAISAVFLLLGVVLAWLHQRTERDKARPR